MEFARIIPQSRPGVYNANWAPYGAYLQKLIEGIDARWQAAIRDAKEKYPATGTSVSVTFVLNDQGVVTSTKPTPPTVDDFWLQLCAKAINPSAGFSHGVWTTEMIAALGHSQELTFYFLFR